LAVELAGSASHANPQWAAQADLTRPIQVRILITGSSGLIGSELVAYFHDRASRVTGVDNNMRADFFGSEGDTRWNLARLREEYPGFQHNPVDVRDRAALERLFLDQDGFDLIIHCA